MLTKDAKKEKTKTSKQTLTTGEIKKLCMKGLGLNTMYTLNDDFIKNKETFSQLWNQKQNRTHCSLKQAGLWFTLRTAGAQILQPLRLGSLFPDWMTFTQGWYWLAGCKISSPRPLKGVSPGSAALLPWLQHNRAFPRSVGTLAIPVPPELGCNCAVDNESWKLCNLCVVLLTGGEQKPQERENPPSSVGMRITPKKSKVNPLYSSLNW